MMKRRLFLLVTSAMMASPLLSQAQTVESTDIVIVGAGGAGLTAAVEAHNLGAKVILLEKMAFVGGNTNRATGGVNAAGTDAQKAKGIEDSAELHYQDTMKGGRNINNPELVRALTDNANDSIKFLKANGLDLVEVVRAGGASVDRSHRAEGGPASGNLIVSSLYKKVKELGIDVRTNSPVTKLLHNEKGEIIGVSVTTNKGEEYIIHAQKVILATGGFGANFEMIAHYDPKLVNFKTTNSPGALGEGMKMAQAVGAKLVDMEYIQIHPTTVPGTGILVTEGMRGAGAILVNEQGKRFTDELKTRDVVSKNILQQPGAHAFLIFNKNLHIKKTVEKYASENYTKSGETLAQLASELKMDPQQLEQTINAYNAYVANQKDEEFGRESLAVALDTGPYYAIEVTPGIHHTMGGVAINKNAQVIDTDGKIIPNLFAAGEVAGGVHGANRLGGNALMDIVTFGRISATQAVKEIQQGK